MGGKVIYKIARCTICDKVLIRRLSLIELFVPTNQKITPNIIKTRIIFYVKLAVDKRISIDFVYLIWGGISLLKTHELLSSILPESAFIKNL